LAGSGQPADRGWVDIVRPRYIGLARTVSKPLERLRQLRRPTKTHPARLGAFPALIRAGFDQVPLERCQACQDRHHQLAMGSGRVRPWVFEGFELCARLRDPAQDAQQIEGRSRAPVKANDDQYIAWADRFQDPAELDTIRFRPGNLLAKDALAAGGLKIGLGKFGVRGRSGDRASAAISESLGRARWRRTDPGAIPLGRHDTFGPIRARWRSRRLE
jgi:hypothetical protein